MMAVKRYPREGTSEASWKNAAHETFREASQSVDDISEINAERWTADVDNGKITEYTVTNEIALPVQH